MEKDKEETILEIKTAAETIREPVEEALTETIKGLQMNTDKVVRLINTSNESNKVTIQDMFKQETD
jgi:hypothetical protein